MRNQRNREVRQIAGVLILVLGVVGLLANGCEPDYGQPDFGQQTTITQNR